MVYGYDKDMKKGKLSDLQMGVEEEIKEGRKELRKSINDQFSL